MSFLFFILITFALCFLAADARIFGGDVTAWNSLRGDPDATEEDLEWFYSLGFIRIRPFLLQNRFVQEHLSCYFCMGVWAGPLAHIFLWCFYQLRAPYFLVTPTDYVLWHPDTYIGWTMGVTAAFLLGSACSYCVNFVLNLFEE